MRCLIITRLQKAKTEILRRRQNARMVPDFEPTHTTRDQDLGCVSAEEYSSFNSTKFDEYT
jgi:hypothetical protein